MAGSPVAGSPVAGSLGANYDLQSMLGSGGQGEVYLASDQHQQRAVAIKFSLRDKAGKGSMRQPTEAQARAAIDHPRVVRVLDVLVADEQLATVMEYVPGVTLATLQTSGSLSLAAILYLALDVASGLSAIRRAGLVHGDIKAENIRVTEGGRIKILDLGIASESFGHARGGSRQSMPPEQMAGNAVDSRSDLYAFGLLLHQLVTGTTHPAAGGEADGDDNPPVVPRLQLGDKTTAGERIPDSAVQLVNWLLEPLAANRPRNAFRVRQELRRMARAAGSPCRVRGQLGAAVSDAMWLEESAPRDVSHFSGEAKMRTVSGLSLLVARHARPLRGWIVAMLTATVVIGAVLSYRHWAMPTLRVQDSHIDVQAGIGLPPELSHRWLARTVTDQAIDLSRLPVKPITNQPHWQLLLTKGELPSAQVHIVLHCDPGRCLLEMAVAKTAQLRRRSLELHPRSSSSQWYSSLFELSKELLADL